jgi:hypothetical protein
MKFTCPSCGFIVFDEPPGSYDICDVCGWEDDAVQLANPCSGGGANGETLAEAQNNFQDTPNADVKEIIAEGYVRDPKWRPLNMTEREILGKEIEILGTVWPNKAVYDLNKAYWNRNIIKEKT